MSAALRLVHAPTAADVTEEDLLYSALVTANNRLRDLNRIERQHPLETTPEWCLFLREYNDAIALAKEHAASLRRQKKTWSPLVDDLMRAHGV